MPYESHLSWDIPSGMDEATALVCPVNFAPPDVDLSETEQLCAALQQEIVLLHTWYDLSVSS